VDIINGLMFNRFKIQSISVGSSYFGGLFSVRLLSVLRGSYPLHYFLILILEKEPVFPFLMLSAKQANYWYHFYNVFGMTRSLTGD